MLLLHGVEHRRPTAHWLWQLAESLRQERVPVQYPQLPSPDAPSLEEWMELARAELAMLGGGDTVVITHSLSGLLWTHLAPTLAPAERPSRVLMVAPPTNDILWDVIEHFAAPDTLALGDIAPTLIVGRQTDDYRTTSLPELAAAWGADHAIVSGHGHLTPDDGYGAWAAPLTWVLTGDATAFAAEPGKTAARGTTPA